MNVKKAYAKCFCWTQSKSLAVCRRILRPKGFWVLGYVLSEMFSSSVEEPVARGLVV